jgi:hypothetical protein
LSDLPRHGAAHQGGFGAAFQAGAVVFPAGEILLGGVMCEPETFWSLFQSPAHWGFEVFLEILSAVITALLWPHVKRVWAWLFHKDC